MSTDDMAGYRLQLQQAIEQRLQDCRTPREAGAELARLALWITQGEDRARRPRPTPQPQPTETWAEYQERRGGAAGAGSISDGMERYRTALERTLLHEESTTLTAQATSWLELSGEKPGEE